MLRIQTVQTALNEIEAKHRAFFNRTGTYIKQYVNIQANKTNDWINVTLKESPALPQEIADDINMVFAIVE